MAKMNPLNITTVTTVKKFLKDPLWLILVAINSFAYYIVDDTIGFFLATVLLTFCLHIIYKTYFQDSSPLRDRVIKELSRFGDDYIVLSSIELREGGLRGYSDFIVISPKGIFNIRTLDLEGVITGYQNDELWEFIKATSPYDVVKRVIKNPIYYHQRTHQIIEALLEQQHIKYIPIQSLMVTHSSLTINTDSRVPIVKSEELFDYISEYADRSIMSSLKMNIEEILIKAVSTKYSYIPMSSK